jgi:hypothetical protein
VHRGLLLPVAKALPRHQRAQLLRVLRRPRPGKRQRRVTHASGAGPSLSRSGRALPLPPAPAPMALGVPRDALGRHLPSKRLVIEARWVSKPLHSLVNCDHGDSTSSRFDSPGGWGGGAAHSRPAPVLSQQRPLRHRDRRRPPSLAAPGCRAHSASAPRLPAS